MKKLVILATALASAVPAMAVGQAVQEETIPLYGRDSFRKVVPTSDSVVYLQARSGQWHHVTLGKGCHGFAAAIARRSGLPISSSSDPSGWSFFNGGMAPRFAGGGTMHIESNRSDGNFGRLSVVYVTDALGPMNCQVESLVESGPPPRKDKG